MYLCKPLKCYLHTVKDMLRNIRDHYILYSDENPFICLTRNIFSSYSTGVVRRMYDDLKKNVLLSYIRCNIVFEKNIYSADGKAKPL